MDVITSTRAGDEMTPEAEAMPFMPISWTAGRKSRVKDFSAWGEPGGATDDIQEE
jgi:hypothetical protein